MNEPPFRRLVIAGCSGAGKSTLARRLGERTGLPVFHLDTLFWKPGWTEGSRTEFDEKVEKILCRDRWIIDGNFGRTLERRVRAADSLVVLDFPTVTCLTGIAVRLWRYYGRSRPDLAPGCPEQIDWDFLEWVCGFNTSTRPKLVETANRVRLDKPVHWFTSRKQMNQWLSTISTSRATDA